MVKFEEGRQYGCWTGWVQEQQAGKSVFWMFVYFQAASLLLFYLNCVEANASQVKRIHVVARENPIVNRLNKTKAEKFPDLREEKEARLRELRKRDQGARDARVSGHSPFCPARSILSSASSSSSASTRYSCRLAAGFLA